MKTNRPTLRGGNARLNFLLWILPLAFFFAGAAAQQSYTRQTTRVERVQMDTTFDATGTATAIKVNAFLRNKLLVSATDSTDVIPGKWAEVDFDLLDPTLASTTIIAGGKTVTYPQLAALIRQAAIDRGNVVGIQ